MSRYPGKLDDDTNLFLVHDSLKLRLAVDYEVGDTSITVEGDSTVFAAFPSSGILTLTEQCSDIESRAISLFYDGKGDMTFLKLQLLPQYTDSGKPKRITSVTQSVMAEHHNALKDALIAIQRFVGIQGDLGTSPLAGSMEARINFLRKLVLKPTAWFTANKRIGVVPLCIEFQDFSTREPEYWNWDFGDGTSASVIRTATTLTGSVSKCFHLPGVFDATLTVSNAFGANTITLRDFVVARVEAPDLSAIDFVPSSDQILSGGVLRTRVDRQVQIAITDSGERPLDAVIRHVWDIEDDLQHDTSATTLASFSAGGLYDVKVKTETELGAFRVTTFEDVIDVVERANLWHFIFDPTEAAGAVTKSLNWYEFSPISEVYKEVSPTSLTVTRNYGFLSGTANESQQVREFRRNNAFTPRSLTGSGDRGTALMFWSEGAALDSTSQKIRFREFNGFDELYVTPSVDNLTRYWNWLALCSASQAHIILGLPGPYPQPAASPASLTHDVISLNNLTQSASTFTSASFLNGATDLMTNPGGGTDGDFSVYRGAWKDSNGYFLRNDGGGLFFRLKGFYATESLGLATEVGSVRKLTDMPGTTKLEGQLVPLFGGLYFFNNTGEVVAYDPVANLWAAGGPGLNSPAFVKLQDITVSDYDDPANTLVACSDGDRQAYMFFDYSTSANVTYNEVDKLFRRLPVRPSGEQFAAGFF